jgi:hypothetical protein
MTRGTKPGRARADAGRPRPIKRGEPLPQSPDDPVRRALSGDVDAEEWEELRVETWQEWARLVQNTDDSWLDYRAEYRATLEPSNRNGGARERAEARRRELEPLCMQPARTPLKDWPPRGARFDGLEGIALARWHQGSPSDLERQIAWAEQGLAELARFRKRSPEAAKSIGEPLREYGRRLRAIRDHPDHREFRPELLRS